MYAPVRHRIRALALHMTMITTYGIKPGKYAGLVQSEFIMDELFD